MPVPRPRGGGRVGQGKEKLVQIYKCGLMTLAKLLITVFALLTIALFINSCETWEEHNEREWRRFYRDVQMDSKPVNHDWGD